MDWDHERDWLNCTIQKEQTLAQDGRKKECQDYVCVWLCMEILIGYGLNDFEDQLSQVRIDWTAASVAGFSYGRLVSRLARGKFGFDW